MRKRKIHTERRIYLDGDEVIDEKSIVYSKIDTSDEVFFWCYDYRLYENLTNQECRVLAYFCRVMQFNSNVLSVSDFFLKEYSKNLLVDVGWLKRVIKSLERKKVLLILDKSTFRVNPIFFWRGDSKGRVKVLKKMIENNEI